MGSNTRTIDDRLRGQLPPFFVVSSPLRDLSYCSLSTTNHRLSLWADSRSG